MSVFGMYMVCISVLCVCIFLKICMYVHVYVCMCQYQLAYGFCRKKYIHIHTNKYTYIHKNQINPSMCIYVHVFWTYTYNTYFIQSNKTFKKFSSYLVCICMYLYVSVFIVCMRYVFPCIVSISVGGLLVFVSSVIFFL